ncbi:MAG: anti-sigma factor [Proteobacteria bacterium]|nr:anti-sigma factor [Pseudomonadota bacterium]
MNCRDARLLLHAWLDDELGAADSLAVARHLQECAACAQRLRNHEQLRGALRGAGLRHAAPAGLQGRIAARLPRAMVAPRRPRQRWMPAAAALAALLVAAIVFAGWQTLQVRRQEQGALVAEAVSGSLRALQPGHLFDVRSTDQHTVKPWFDGRLDFSPVVKDLSAQGFDLIGGRLDALAAHRVAALAYRRHLHVINLFEWPSNALAPGGMRTRDGYHVVQWNDAGMYFVAVSDVAPADLDAFVRAFRATPVAAGEPAR